MFNITIVWEIYGQFLKVLFRGPCTLQHYSRNVAGNIYSMVCTACCLRIIASYDLDKVAPYGNTSSKSESWPVEIDHFGGIYLASV